MCSSVTVPTASNLRSSASVRRCCASSGAIAPPPPNRAAVAAPTCSNSRRLIIQLVPDARHAELQPFVLRGEVKLEVAVFLGVRRQFVRADVHLTPLEALANIPDRQKARAPGREVIV